MKGKNIILSIITLIFGCLFGVIMVVGLVGLIHYEQVLDRAPEVSGILTHIEEYEDSDGDIRYYLRVEYEYNGTHYDSRYDSCNYKEGKQRLGEAVTFLIDPEEPGSLMHRNRESSLLLFYVGMLAFGFLGIPVLQGLLQEMSLGRNETYGELYGMSAENIKKDLFRNTSSLGVVVFFNGSAGLVLGCGFLIPRAIGDSAFVVGIILLVLGIRLTVREIRKRRSIRGEEYSVRMATVESHQIVSDSEGPDDHYLWCTDGQNRWRTRVSVAVFKFRRDGDRVRCVFLNGKNVPDVVYWNVNG